MPASANVRVPPLNICLQAQMCAWPPHVAAATPPSSAPATLQELLDSGYLTQVHKFSKFIHGSATLFPDMVSRAVP